jgi:hypothetical protein
LPRSRRQTLRNEPGDGRGLLCEAVSHAFTMLGNPANEIIGHTNVQRSTQSARENVDEVLLHQSFLTHNVVFAKARTSATPPAAAQLPGPHLRRHDTTGVWTRPSLSRE